MKVDRKVFVPVVNLELSHGVRSLQILVNNFHTDAAKTYNIPEDNLYEVGILYKI